MEIPKYTVEQRNLIPDDPGVYKFYTKENQLIYVGKAKNLKKRVTNYFSKSHTLNRKTLRLVQEIESIEITIANSEFDALLLENNLIKENQPKYNILLKDDKTFPYICIVKERFPRIISTRKYEPKSGEFFGPYTSVVAMKSILDLIRKLYTIRTCKLNLSENNIRQQKFKVCLEYHIGNCLGPCENLQSENDYLQEIEQARKILKGDLAFVHRYFKEQMITASSNLKFEVAQKFKEKLELIDKFQVKSLVVNPRISELDVFALVDDQSKAYVNYLQIKNGAIILANTVEIKKKLDEPSEDLLKHAIIALQHQHNSPNKEIVCNIEIELSQDYNLVVPKIGDKKKLLDLSLKNAVEYKHKKQSTSKKSSSTNDEILKQLQDDLRLSSVPNHIECFDNSNLQGTSPVASMVCFKNGKPSKKDYRHYNIKTVVGPDDFASMREIVNRRYKRVLDEHDSVPDLIVIDGGKGQLSSACEALKELSLYGKIPVIGIAKRLEEIYFPEDSIPVHINKKSMSLRLLQFIRDEAHRFAITFHRQKRSKTSFNISLEDIDGIGKETTDKLLRKYKSVKKIEDLKQEELESIIGKSKAKIIWKHFNK